MKKFLFVYTVPEFSGGFFKTETYEKTIEESSLDSAITCFLSLIDYGFFEYDVFELGEPVYHEKNM